MGMMKFASYRVTHNLLLGRWNYCFVESQVLFRICSSPQSSPADNCREQGWLLKNSLIKNSQKLLRVRKLYKRFCSVS